MRGIWANSVVRPLWKHRNMTQHDPRIFPDQTAPPAQEFYRDTQLTIQTLLPAFWRGKWIILAAALVSVLTTTYYVFNVAKPLYTSDAVVILETQPDRVVELPSVVGNISGEASSLNSEVEVMLARTLMGQVTDQLRLTEDPEFNPSLRPSGWTTVLKRKIEAAYSRQDRSGVSVSPDDQFNRDRDTAVKLLLSKVTVRNIPNSLVFKITVESTEPEKSARIADAIAEHYIQNQLEQKYQAMDQATLWLSTRVSELQQQLEQAETRAAKFSSSIDLVSADSLQSLERQLKDLRQKTTAAREREVGLRAHLAQLQRAQTPQQRAAVANDDKLDLLLAAINADADAQVTFDVRFHQVLTRARLDSNRSVQQLVTLQEAESELESQINRQGNDLITLQQLTREAEAGRLLYEHFLNRLNETSAQQGIQQPDSRILSRAMIANTPNSPRKSLLVSMSAIFGVVLGTLYVLLRETGNVTFRSARDLEAYTGGAVLGQLPTIPGEQRRDVLDFLSEQPTSTVTEAIRSLRTSLLLSSVQIPSQVLVLSSSMPDEGKTTLSLTLAQSLAGMGKKVLVVEGDVRRRTIHEYFEDLPHKGLLAVLHGICCVDDAVGHPAGFRADVLAAERPEVNPADLFSSEPFRELIVKLRESYDHVIIDCPPVLAVPDARILAQLSDRVLLSVKWNSTSKEQLDETLRLFRSSNVEVTGLVLNQINPKDMKRYGYGGRTSCYAGYGQTYEAA